MLSNVKPITSEEFNKGLVTRSDFLKGDINASPNTMDVQWNFDASLHKRFGYSSTNTIILGSTSVAGWIIDSNGTLSTNLQAYWKLDEPSDTRYPSFGSINFNDLNGTPSVPTGIRNAAASFVTANSNALYAQNNSSIQIGTGNWSINLWVNFQEPLVGNKPIFAKALVASAGTSAGIGGMEYYLLRLNSSQFEFGVSANGSSLTSFVDVNVSINTSTWINVLAWHSNNSHIGIRINNASQSTASHVSGVFAGTNNLVLSTQANTASFFATEYLDEIGVWNKVLSTQERTDLYAGATGNTFSPGISAFGWGMFDFGASSIRWLTVAAGTGILASSNLGTTFVSIYSSRTQNYQSFARSKNVLIATSDSYDPTLYWAGSAGTTAVILAQNSAPAAKFSINYQGFLILLNSKDSNGTISTRRFSYADENLQITDTWTTGFDIPSSADDEITAPFILNKFMYISTRYSIFRVAFVGGNPDWSYLKVKDWGFVPRTVQIVSLKGGGQVAVGMDWDRRIRLFDGFDDRFASDNIENDNGVCDFAMNKVSYSGSGLVISHAVLNPVNQEYRLNVAIGPMSTQVTHSIILNARNLAFYPYSNQNWQAMCVAESNNQRHLMAVDRSGYVYILDSGNLDVKQPINDIYDSPPLFSASPEVVSKGHQLNLFFAPESCGTIYIQDRTDLSNQWSKVRPLTNRVGNTQITGSENLIKVLRTVDVPSTYNTYQFRLTTSSGTAAPYELDRLDFLQQGFGIGLGK